MQAFMGRLLFMNGSYNGQGFSNYKGNINVGYICNMNASEEMMSQFGYDSLFKWHNMFGQLILNGKWEYMTVNDTCQFDDYSKYDADGIDEQHKKEVRDKQFSIDCHNAFEMGKRLAKY
ncbi:MAG: hypothetical protein LBJ58_02600 [Tannerellaceae bacterium]|jgi:hypothetical protein|nr:hypothetical protein [Tannerellaceae bacterium]